MHPHPQIRWDLSPEEEARAFEALKPRLARLWADVFPKDDEPYMSVIVPSVTLDDDGAARGETGALFYMVGAVSELGRLGMVAVGNSREAADTIFRRTVAALDAASAFGPAA